MNADILDSSSPPAREGSIKKPIHPSSPSPRHWRLSLTVSLGVLLLLASLVIAALSLHSHAGSSSASSYSAAASAEDWRWYSLGYVDIEGGVTPLYPLQPGRVQSIDAKENDFIKAGTPLFHLENTIPLLKVREAEGALKGDKAKLAVAEAELEQANKRIEAQKTAVEAARNTLVKARLNRDKKKDWEKKGLQGDKESVQAAEVDVEQADLGVKGEEHKLAIAEAAKRQAESYIAAMRASIEVKQAQLEEANKALNECVVRAPDDGIPLRILVTKGQVLGSNPREPAVWFAADRPLLVRAEVEQEFVEHVRPDQSVMIEDNVTGRECARGRVVSLARWYAPHRTIASPEMPGLNNETRTLECIIHVESKSREIRIGQRVRVQFPD